MREDVLPGIGGRSRLPKGFEIKIQRYHKSGWFGYLIMDRFKITDKVKCFGIVGETPTDVYHELILTIRRIKQLREIFDG